MRPAAVHSLARIAILATGLGVAGHAMAGMNQDLADCTAADRKASADACTRVIDSGRLPRAQFYIGYFNRGWSNFNAGKLDKALSDFDRSISYNPGYADTYFSRAVVQHERGARDQSLADLDRYKEKRGEAPEAYLNRAQVFRARGELDQAFSELQRSAALDPGEVRTMALRALVLAELGEQEPARLEAEKAVTAKPDAAMAYYARAFVARRAKDLDAAARDADKAIALKDKYPQAHVLKGEILEEKGDAPRALASYRRSLQVTSKSIDARTAQANRSRQDRSPRRRQSCVAAAGEGGRQRAAKAGAAQAHDRMPPLHPLGGNDHRVRMSGVTNGGCQAAAVSRSASVSVSIWGATSGAGRCASSAVMSSAETGGDSR